MGAIKRGCLEFLIVWGLAGFAMLSQFQGKFEPPGDQWGAGIGGFFVACAWGSFRNALIAIKRRQLLASARQGARPVDGKTYAAAGTIRALGEPLKTPFQKRSCISYGYDLSVEQLVTTGTSDNRTTRHEKNVSMGGFAMCPSAVRTAGTEVRILGFPFPHEFPEDRIPARELHAEVRAYLESANFEISKGLAGVRSLWTQLQSLLADDDGSHRHDWRTANAEEMLSDPKAVIMEQYIPVGAEVCVIGKYSQSKGGLVTDFSSGGLEVLAGGLQKGLKTYYSRIIWGFVGTAFFAALGTVGVHAILSFRERKDNSVQEKHVERLRIAITENDLPAATQALEHGVSLLAPEGNLRDAISNCKSIPMLELLIKHDLYVNRPLSYGYTLLMKAVADGDVERVKFLLDTKADPNIAQPDWGITPLERAFDSGKKEIFTLLRNKGARGMFVTADTGKPLSGDGGAPMEAVRQLLDAWEADDAAKVRALSDAWPEDFFDSFKRGLYHRNHKCGPVLEAGFANDEAGTIIIQCRTLPVQERWIYTVVKRAGVWKVRRSDWDEQLRFKF